MFGLNPVVGKGYFREAPFNSLMVTSIFMTLQGEGPYAGRPALFIRLAHCNLNCSFCDTYFSQGEYYDFQKLDDLIRITIDDFFYNNGAGMPAPDWALYDSNSNQPRRMVLVITGGEPTLQPNLIPFIHRHEPCFEAIQIETNGTLLADYSDVPCTVVCSPKCLEEDGRPVRYLKPSPAMLARADCLKFVLSADPESPYHEVPLWGKVWSDVHRKPVFVSPMNIYNHLPQKAKLLRASKDEITLAERSTVDEVISFWEPGLLNMEQNQKNHEYAGRYAALNGFQLNLQMHLYASLA